MKTMNPTCIQPARLLNNGRAVTLLLVVLTLLVPACQDRPEKKLGQGNSEGPDNTELLYAATTPPVASPVVSSGSGSRPEIIVADCRLSVIDKQDVPSRREGVLLFIGTDIQPGEQVQPELQITVQFGKETRTFRRLKEGDYVKAGQLLAQMDDRLVRDELAMKEARITASKADLASAEKVRDESKSRFDTQLRLIGKKATSEEEVHGARLAWDRATFDAVSKHEAVRLAEVERKQALTILGMHAIRSDIPGIIKTIYRKRGESVKNLDPVVQVLDLARLRVEGLVPIEYLPRLGIGAPAQVEPIGSDLHEHPFRGHLREVTAVAVGKDAEGWLVVSASEDGTARVCERASRKERGVLDHPAAVRALACGRAGPAAHWCVTGAADGVARVWDLKGPFTKPLRELAGQHRGPMCSVAISPDGHTCATAGEDSAICLWDLVTGALRYRLPPGHRAAVTSLQFTPNSELISAARDNTLRLWKLSKTQATLAHTLGGRTGDVATLGASCDGQRILFDQGRLLRVLTLPDRRTVGTLENCSEATHFTTLALFSPDARYILTACNGEGTLQLWRSPDAASRACEVHRLMLREPAPVTCAAFSPDGTFVVAGTKNQQVLLWNLPPAGEVGRSFPAQISLVEQVVESSNRQARLWAEVANPEGRFIPGTAVTLVIPVR